MTDTPQWQGHSSGPFPHGAAGPQPPYGPQSSQAVPAPGGFQGGVGWQNPPGVGGFPTQPVMQQPAQAPYLPAGAPASYQAGPAYPGAPDGGAPTRRRRTAVIVAVVVVLVLAVAGGGAAYWWLRGYEGKSADLTKPTSGWSKAWANGYEEVWALDAPKNEPGPEGRVSIEHVGDYVIRVVSESGQVHVEVFSLTSKTPKLLWEEDFESEEEFYYPDVWNGKLVEDDKLVDLGSQKHEDAPWKAGASIAVNADKAISCEGATCTMWSSPSQRVWQEKLPLDDPKDVTITSRVGHYAMAWTYHGKEDRQSLFIDLNTGKTKALKQESGTSLPFELQDGWLLYNSQSTSSEQPDTVTLFDPDGSVKETFEVGVPEDFTDYPWSPQDLTLDQARAWFKNGDTSWAPSTYSINKDDEECRSITVAGQRIDLGEDNSQSSKLPGGCYGITMQAIHQSGDGEIGVFSEHKSDDETVLHLVDMSTGKSPAPLPLGDWHGYIPEGDFLITYEDNGAVKAYRPS